LDPWSARRGDGQRWGPSLKREEKEMLKVQKGSKRFKGPKRFKGNLQQTLFNRS